MKFYIETLGCKVNSYESNYITESLVNNGFLLTYNVKEADIIIINTCTVTNTADSKSLKLVRKLKRENESAIMVVCGCSVQNNSIPYSELGIDILLGNKDKSKLLDLINSYLKTKQKYEFIDKNRNIEFEDMSIYDFSHTRAFIKIQDGCDNFCSYCIIPFVRGKCRSKNFAKVIMEATSLVESGHKEIVLTGIHTGSYNDNGKDLVDLINEISKIDGLLRIRLSSVEITELNDKFLNMLKTNSKFCKHLHIPLQAGSDEILKLMNRKYSLDYYFKKINDIRKIIPDISVTTDVIVGHPYETDSLFSETLRTCKKIEFSKIHVFPYSDRVGTKASLMNNKVSDAVKKERVHQLLELSNKLEKKYYESFIGKKVDVLVEEVKDDYSIGHTSNYLQVKIPKKLEKNKIYSWELK